MSAAPATRSHGRHLRPVPASCLVAAWLALTAAATGATGDSGAAMPADFLIRGGTIHDGSENAPYTGDVVIRGDRIVYAGPDASARYAARETVGARGKVVAPGFIDPHTHPDRYVRSTDAKERLNAPWLFQGVTTLMIGVDGGGTFRIAEQASEFERQKVGTNLAAYVGFSSIRQQVLGASARAPSPAELASMRDLVASAMCEGAYGLSTGLFYAPQSFASTEEVVELARVAARHGGLYDTHQRDESSYSIGLLRSVEEVLRIGREAGLPVHIAHIKALGVDVQGQSGSVIALIDAARAKGQIVSADQYPWAASGTGLEAALLPAWSVDGGRPALLRRLADPGELEKIIGAMEENLRRRGGAESLLLTAADTPWTGKTLAQVAKSLELEPAHAALELIRAGEVETDVASFNMIESDIRAFMRQPWVITSSDGSDGHPRQYATFPMKYARYVRGEQVIDLPTFIRTSTGRTAAALGLHERGLLRAGHFADVVVFDPERFAPVADYVRPRELSRGVTDVFVNGRPAISNGALTGEAAGRALKHAPTSGSCPEPRVTRSTNPRI
jgi:N-acyl-D-amino-acid deacylase